MHTTTFHSSSDASPIDRVLTVAILSPLALSKRVDTEVRKERGGGASPALDRAYSARVSELTRTRIHLCSLFFFPFSTCWYGFEFKGSRAMKPRGPQKAKSRRRHRRGGSNKQLLRSSFNRPSVRCGPSTRLGRHLRSRFRCSMCSAVRMD